MTERTAYRLVRRPAAPLSTPLDDPEQRRVVAHRDGPLLVLGGPGTGKTSTLVESVAARVAEGTDPQRILVLTFGRRGATRLRDRIEARIAAEGELGGAVTAGEPMVRTFHGYAFGLLRRASAEHDEPAPRLLTGPEQDVVIRELVSPDDDLVAWPEAIRPALPTRAFAQQLRDLLLRAAERGISADELATLGERLGRPDWPAAARFLQQYQQILALRDTTGRGSVGFDAAELVRAATALLQAEPDLLAAERQRLSYVYVDELADTDPAQVDLLALVAGGGAPLVAFADPDSSTFAFRGADPTVVSAFPDRFLAADGGLAPTVTLLRSYRSGPELVAATRRLARRLRGPVRHRLITSAVDDTSGEVEIRTFRTVTTEAAYVAHRLREAHLLDGIPWSRMAIVVRSVHRQLAGLQRALAQAEVPNATRAEDLALHLQPAIAPLLLLLRCALDPDRLDEDAALALLHSPLGGADPLAERRLRQGLRALALAAGDTRPSGVLLVEALREPAELVAIERRWAAPAKAVATLIATARATADRPGSTVEDVLWEVWSASGLAEKWVAVSLRPAARVGPEDRRADAADRDLDAVVALFDAAARFSDRLPGARMEVFLDHVLSQDLPSDSLAPIADRGDAVRVLTAHAAKGQEWDVVAVVGVQEGAWPDLRLRGSLLGSEVLVDVSAGRATTTGGQFAASQTAAMLDEERRLFYVATTRARRRLLVTAVASDGSGAADQEEQPSRFLDELAADAPDHPEEGPPAPRRPDDPDDDGGPIYGRHPEREDTGELLFEPGASLPPAPDVAANLAGEAGDDWEPAGARNGAGHAPETSAHGTAGAALAPGAGEHGTAGAGETGAAREAGDDDGSVVPPTAAPTTRLPRALTLPALVAELRRVVVDEATEPERRRAAAAQLARLAEADVPGADPDDWWGLPELSDDRPLADEGEPVTVTPSTVEGALRCGLQWLLRRHGGDPPATAAQGIGNLVHAAAMLAQDASVDRAELAGYVAARFDAIELAARWLAERERGRADQMLDKLLAWLAANPRRVAAIEKEFLVRLGEGVELKGRVDRLEIDDQGRLVVIDLKTGKSKPTAAEVEEHPQLGAYQAAVEAGAFAELGTESGGAALVQLGTSGKQAEQFQPSTEDSPEPGWARSMIRRAADTMAASTFEAVTNAGCRACPVRTACPISGRGRQVHEP